MTDAILRLRIARIKLKTLVSVALQDSTSNQKDANARNALKKWLIVKNAPMQESVQSATPPILS